MCETAIIDEVTSIPWEIVAEDSAGNEIPGKEKEIEIVNSFFENPNTNPESWETIIRMMLPDLLEINSGILVKTFNSFGKMVEIVARNGAAFTKNPDIYGMYTNRADLILIRNIMSDRSVDAASVQNQAPFAENQNLVTFPLLQPEVTGDIAREEAAYFQYGFNTAARPVPFGKREIVWVEKKVRTDNLYGRSAMEVLAKTVQTLIYAVEHNLEFFNNNSIPPGVLGFEGMSAADLKAFGSQWIQNQRQVDELGNWRKVFHKLPMVGKLPKFERLGFTNQELELIESQKWWSKMVWAAFGMTATELGFTEDAKGSANQIVQTSVAKKRIIYPILRLIEYYVNTQIVPEFGFEGIRYKYKVFDVDDEMKKWGLYDLQVKGDLKTVNEIRNAEGLDPVEWGDKNAGERSPNQGITQNIGDPRQQDADKINNDAQRDRDKKLNKPKPNEKALTTDTPLTLEANERMNDKKLRKEIEKLLNENKKKLIEIIGDQTKKEPLINIKGVDDIPGLIKTIFASEIVKRISDSVIKSEFDSGWNSIEKQLDINIPYNESALKFLQTYTFDNIKGMTEDISNDLKSELSRGIIDGEGITKLKARVEKVFNKGENRAEMIARTETNRAENQGRLLAMKGSGIEDEYNKEWVSALDDRTSPLCKRLDGQTVSVNGNFKDTKSGWEGQASPSHVNCRSRIIFVEKE